MFRRILNLTVIAAVLALTAPSASAIDPATKLGIKPRLCVLDDNPQPGITLLDQSDDASQSAIGGSEATGAPQKDEAGFLFLDMELNEITMSKITVLLIIILMGVLSFRKFRMNRDDV